MNGKKLISKALNSEAGSDSPINGGELKGMISSVACGVRSMVDSSEVALLDGADRAGGATVEMMSKLACFGDFADAIKEQKESAVTSLREYRMALNSEVSQIEKLHRKVSGLEFGGLAKSLADVSAALADPNVKRLIDSLESQ